MNDPNENEWTDDDNIASLRQGWFLANIWDGKTERLEYEISAYLSNPSVFPTPFKSDEQARAFVLAKVQAGDKLAQKAARVVFISKVKGVPKGKKK